MEQGVQNNELAPFLNQVQAIALALAEFLEALRLFLADRDAIAALRETPYEERALGREAYGLLDFYGACGNLANRLHEQGAVTSYVWEQTYDLCVWFAYLGSSMTASSSLISAIPFVMTLFEKDSSSDLWDDDKYIELSTRILKKELIQGLYHISRRAELLANTPEGDLKSQDLSWWCMRVDSTPKDGGAYYKLGHLVNECPDPVHPEAAARLEQIATAEEVDENIRDGARRRLRGAA